MTTKRQDDQLPLPPGVWEALAKEILNDGKEHRAGPVFSPLAPMASPQNERQGVAVVHRDLPHFLREEEAKTQRDSAGERGGFGALAVILCLIGATAAGLGGYLISTNATQGFSALAWVERLIKGQQPPKEEPQSIKAERAATPSRVDTAFASVSKPAAVEAARTGAGQGSALPAAAAGSGAAAIAAGEAAASPASAGAGPLAALPAAGISNPAAVKREAAPVETPAPAKPAANAGETAKKPQEVASLEQNLETPRQQPSTLAPTAPPPASPPALSQPKPLRGPTAESTRLVERARKMIEETGDISGARLLLARAIEIGDAQAAFLLAETYDARTLTRWGVVGLRGDSATARRYYEQALAGGVGDARGRIAGLAK